MFHLIALKLDSDKVVGYDKEDSPQELMLNSGIESER